MASDVPVPEEQEKARRLATVVVSIAIGLAGVTLAVFAVVLTAKGGLGFLFLSVILFALGAALALIGFFFQLVPVKLEELAEQTRDYDKRQRDLGKLR